MLRIFVVFILIFTTACASMLGKGYPPSPIIGTGHYGMATQVDVMSGSGSEWPYSPDQLACLVDATHRAYLESVPNDASAPRVQQFLAHHAFDAVTEEEFVRRCRVPSSQATSCELFWQFPDGRQGFWYSVIRGSHFDAYHDVPGEPMIHELIHAIASYVLGNTDNGHRDPRLWEMRGQNPNVQTRARALFQGCIELNRRAVAK